MKKILVLIVALICLSSAAYGGVLDIFKKKGDNKSKKIKIAVIVKGTEHVYWQTVKKGVEDAASDLDVDYYFIAAPGGEPDINGQVDLVEAAIAQKVDGMVLAASDSNALVRPIKKAMKAGIPVVLIDSGVETDKYSSFIATNNIETSYKVGDALGKLLNGKGKVGVVNFQPGAGTAIEREQGFRNVMKEKYPGIELLETKYSYADKQKALSITEDLVTAHNDLDAIYAANEPTLVGVGIGIKEKGLKDKVLVAGFDSSDDVLKLLNEGIVKVTAVQMPYSMGYKGIKSVVKALKGEKIEKLVDSGAVIVTPENMNTPESQKALFPLKK